MRQCLTQFFCGLFVSDRLQGSRNRFCLEDPFNRFAIIGMVKSGMTHGGIDILAMISFFLPEDVSGMKPAIFRMVVPEPFEEGITMIAQCNKLIPYRFKAIAYLSAVNELRIQPGPP